MSPLKVLLCLLVCAIPAWSFVINPEGENRARNESRINYQLFTRRNPDEPQIMILEDLETLLSSNFDPKLPTKFFAHGFNGDATTADPKRIEYLIREDCNFIAIDWAWLAAGIDYPMIILRNVPIVANHTAVFIDYMVELVSANVSTMHLIGHSAGAHVVGGIGAMITSGRIPRITGLDPAKPFLTLENIDNRLDTTDADFVDVIHTDSGNLTGLELGFFAPIGHIDFYPNGGTDQPGCHLPPGQAKLVCDHDRAPAYFTESINSPVGFRAVQCDSWDNFLIGRCNNNPSELLGEPVTYGAEGIYYLATNAEPPYAIEG